MGELFTTLIDKLSPPENDTDVEPEQVVALTATVQVRADATSFCITVTTTVPPAIPALVLTLRDPSVVAEVRTSAAAEVGFPFVVHGERYCVCA